MSDSLLDEALQYCNDTLLEMRDTPIRAQLRARHGVLERATWSLSLLPATAEQVVGLARLVLSLRDDVTDARTGDEAHRHPGCSSSFGDPRGRTAVA